MKKYFKFLLFSVSVAAVNNIASLDRTDNVRERELRATTELFRVQVATELADQAMTLSGVRWKKVLSGTIKDCLARGASSENIARYKQLNRALLMEGINFRNNCRVLEADKRAAAKRIAKAEFIGAVAEGIRGAAHSEILACNPLEQARYIEAVAHAAAAHSISVKAQNDLTTEHKELDYILLSRQKLISEFSRTMAVAAWQIYQKTPGDRR